MAIATSNRRPRRFRTGPRAVFVHHNYRASGAWAASIEPFARPISEIDGLSQRIASFYVMTAWTWLVWATRWPSSSVMSVATTMVVRPVWTGRAAACKVPARSGR